MFTATRGARRRLGCASGRWRSGVKLFESHEFAQLGQQRLDLSMVLGCKVEGVAPHLLARCLQQLMRLCICVAASMTMDDAQAPQRQELVAGKGAKGRMMTSWLGGGEQGPQGAGNAP